MTQTPKNVGIPADHEDCIEAADWIWNAAEKQERERWRVAATKFKKTMMTVRESLEQDLQYIQDEKIRLTKLSKIILLGHLITDFDTLLGDTSDNQKSLAGESPVAELGILPSERTSLPSSSNSSTAELKSCSDGGDAARDKSSLDDSARTASERKDKLGRRSSFNLPVGEYQLSPTVKLIVKDVGGKQ